MISITPHMRVLCFTGVVDFRKGIDGLLGICRAELKEVDPFSGTLFLFKNRSQTTIKGVVYDGQGFWLFAKRLSSGKFSYWPTGKGSSVAEEILSRELSILLWNGDPRKALMGSDWKPLAQSA